MPEKFVDKEEVHQKTAMYERIAIDIAFSIVNGELKEEEIIKGRSTLSGKYNVSPETIRRAVKLLEEVDVVQILDRKGIVVKSRNAASLYIKDFNTKDKILNLREEITSLVDSKIMIDHQILERVNTLIEQAMLLKNVGVIYPLEALIPENSSLAGRSIGNTRFWYHTGATIIGINRNEHLVLSPGPEFVFESGDIILYVGNTNNNSRQVNSFIQQL